MGDREQTKVIEEVAAALDELNIGYAIGGSVASSLYGTVRFTRDADITVEDFRGFADGLYERLKDNFYVSREAMEEALNSRGSFNAIDLESGFKVDLFIQGQSEFDRQLLTRSRRVSLGDSAHKPFCVVSPEDVILLKLRWYSQSGCVSDRQWDDVLGVLAVQGKSLDFEYLQAWSDKLGLREVLERAIVQSRA
ncbi:MAG: hypothetical protein JSU94_05160 [Phycisphaerales bacterium]|nr:MAG: hypothetical protein JSU94_05160 [Phycisphaerales bacterium]